MLRPFNGVRLRHDNARFIRRGEFFKKRKRTGRQLFEAKTSWGEQLALTWVQVDSSGGLHGCSCPGRRCSTRFHRSARPAKSTSFYINSIQAFANSHVFPISRHTPNALLPHPNNILTSLVLPWKQFQCRWGVMSVVSSTDDFFQPTPVLVWCGE